MRLLRRLRWHDWTRWDVLTKAAKSEDANVVVRSCKECGLYQKRSIEARGGK